MVIQSPSISYMNTFIGSDIQQATSVVTDTNPGCYEQTQGCFSVYGFEYKPGFDNAYVSWISGGQLAWTFNVAGVGPDPIVNISARPVPQEPMMHWDYVMYAETVVYGLLKRFLGPAPIYTALGNHDTYNQAQDAPYALGGQLAAQYSWNYDYISSLWKYEGWISESTVKEAMTHYAAYSVRRPDGLRIITLNTDMWYRPNFFNYINMTTPDVSGLFRFVTDELQAAEDVGDRVWIMGHVPPGCAEPHYYSTL